MFEHSDKFHDYIEMKQLLIKVLARDTIRVPHITHYKGLMNPIPIHRMRDPDTGILYNKQDLEVNNYLFVS